jgi:N-acetylneuraminic acid mutarotase
MNFSKKRLSILVTHTTILFSVIYLSFFQLASAQVGESSVWTIGSPMPRPTTEVAAAVLGDTIYIVGGYDEAGEGVGMVEVYNATSDTWMDGIAQLPVQLHHTSAASYQGKIYVAGGYTGDWTASDRLFIYDPTTNEWTLGNPMPTPRGYPTSNFVNGTLYVVGGDGGANNERALNVTESYDPASNQWTSQSSMPTARHHAASAIVDGKLYVVGGRIGEELNNIDLIEMYNPVSDTWTTELEPMPSKRSGIGAVSVNGFIYVLGGEETQKIFDQNERYDPLNDTWNKEIPLPAGRHGLGVASIGDKIYAIGGGPVPGFYTSGMNTFYDIFNGTSQQN